MMQNKRLKSEQNIIIKVLQLVLCAYIMVVPTINALNIWFLGYGLQVYFSLLIFVLVFLSRIMVKQYDKRTFFSVVVFLAFVIQLVIQAFRGTDIEIGLLLLFMLYICFLLLPEQISMKKIYCAYFIALIISAFYTLVLGLAGSSISRTATSVDGSVGIIGLAICMFLKENYKKGKVYELLKMAAFVSSLIVLGFGMSRARLALGLLLLILRFFQICSTIIRTGKVNVVYVLALPVIILIVVFVFQLQVTQSLLSEIAARFDAGFLSQGRTDEIVFGWEVFKNNFWAGAGFGKMMFMDYQNFYSEYYNHCMYVAILARGGILLGVPFYLSFVSIIMNSLKSKNLYLILLMGLFFVLGYGNAGLFNYTIVGFLIPLVTELKKQKGMEAVGENECNVYS